MAAIFKTNMISCSMVEVNLFLRGLFFFISRVIVTLCTSQVDERGEVHGRAEEMITKEQDHNRARQDES